jgi:hypothetical protein
MDLSGTALAGYSDSDILAGGTRFRRSDGTLLDDDATHPKVKDVLTNLDGLGRDDRVRYDSPGFGGFKVSLGTVQGGAWDTALRYSGELANGTRIVGALGYADLAGDDSALESQLNGSASVLLPSGFNATLAAGRGESDAGDDVTFYYGKVGYQARLIAAGKTAFSVDYHQT